MSEPEDWDASGDEESENEATAVSSASNDNEESASDSDELDSDDDNENEDGSGKPAAQDHETKVLSAYRKLLSRRVDLVGDYAGDELFIIEGDSLLLRCFSDSNLDFSPGCQMLHAAYNVEHLLQNLVQRKCNFNVVFFDCNRELCIPPHIAKEDYSKLLLTRAAIIRHLRTNVAKGHPELKVDVFESYEVDAFKSYMKTTGPYFIMTHDGAAPVDRKAKHMTEDSLPAAKPSIQRVALREQVLFFIEGGYNVALINGLEWRDTKVMTMVLEGRHHRANPIGAAATRTPQSTLVEFEGAEQLEKLKGEKLTERQLLAVIVISKVLQDSQDSQAKGDWKRLCISFLQHEALLAHLPLSARRMGSDKGADGAQDLIRAVAAIAESALLSTKWRGALESQTVACDVVDFLDGRLFLQLSHSFVELDEETQKSFEALASAVEKLLGTDLTAQSSEKQTNSAASNDAGESAKDPRSLAVLPFGNSVFDKHLEPVRLKIDEGAAGEQSYTSHKIFQELTHWHNAKRPIIVKGPPTAASIKQEKKAAKRNQLFMAEMATYAASLTNATGRSLDPETIIVGFTKAPSVLTPPDSDDTDSSASTPKKKAGGKKAGGGGKTAQKNAGKQAMMNSIAANKAKKDESAGGKVASAWQTVCKNIDADNDPRSRYRKAKDYLTNMKPAWREVVGAECELYMLSNLVQYWIDACRNDEHAQRVEVAALIWNLARSIMRSKSQGLTKTVAKNVKLTADTLQLPKVPSVSTDALPDRKLSFTFALSPASSAETLSVKMPSTEFQLTYAGPYLERSFDSKPDSRVDFHPDGWQRRVLDGIDANKSVFAVAPTSAGKTFISFYAMRKVLEADDEGVLVYVAPTKALVNQIAAEIQARYSKNFKYGGKSVWAIHTRDYRINSPNGCQVLVTVPHVLQIMLLAPSNANSWSSRVRRIIFDEVHSIGQAEDGVVWEQLLLMAPCPIIALSATVGNPNEFADWLTSTQKAIGIDLVTVQHPYRYSDLRKYFYLPPKKFAFQGIPDKSAFGTLGLEGLTGFNHVHPVAGLVDKTRGIPADLGLEPRDCLELYNAMQKHKTEDYPVPKELNPETALPEVSRKMDILEWEKKLKNLLREWMDDYDSPYDAVLKELEQPFRYDERDAVQTTKPSSDDVAVKETTITDPDDVVATTLPMLCRLQEQDALPAILFNYDRHMCEKICQALLEQMQKAETEQRKTGPKWEKTLERWEQWKKAQEKVAAKMAKTSKKVNKGQDGDEKGSKLDQQRDAGEEEVSPWVNFSPDAPVEGFHFADHTKLQMSELEIYIKQLGYRGVPQWLIDSITRGIGVHHAGMNRKYRQVVEILFRKGFLRVIIATGTLALGINMPCKTVVFSGDSVFLTALNFRQCAGRAGRRGFDLLGNVVFQGVSRQKVCRLISSRLPDLNGHFPITTTLVLRLFTLLHESKNSKYAVGAITALLSQPRLYMGGASFKDATMHHLRFSIEYLRRQHLLGANGAPLNFAGMVSHLYFTENSSFAFHALLKEGYFHELCAGIVKNEKKTLETLMLVLAHLFNRKECRQADPEFREKAKSSSSIVFLPPLPKQAADVLRSHNKQTLQVFKTYVETFVTQHIKEEDRKLPLSGVVAGGEDSAAAENLQHLPQTTIRSPFVALSGAGDEFTTIHDLCQTTRDGVFLEEAVIPHVDVYPDEMEVPLNAWLLDFYKHGDIYTLERANGIRRADVWFMLNDFSLVLATIITSLMNFMKLKEGTDTDMLDVMGDLDVHEEAEDDQAADSEETQSVISGPSVADSAISMPDRSKQVTKKNAKKADSWEEVADEENTAIETEERRAANAARLDAEAAEDTNKRGKEEGLRNVLKAFQKLHAEFYSRFRAMWA